MHPSARAGRYLVVLLTLMQSVALAQSALAQSTLTQSEPGHTDSERIEWTKTPIRMVLRVGHERMVHFPAPVSVGVPGSVAQDLRTQSVNGTVYFLAKAPFTAARIMVREIDSGQMYLFDVTAVQKSGPSDPVTVYVGRRTDGGSATPSGTVQYSAVALTRFAAQQLYAPLRLVHRWPGIVRVPVRPEPVPLVRGDTVEAVPLISWRAGGLYVTAVKLTNRAHRAQILDPRTLRGRWRTATFQHSRLLPAGDAADTTAAYLISDQPFEASF